MRTCFFSTTQSRQRQDIVGISLVLGAGAIGCFAYRAGFANNLLGNASASTTGVARGGGLTSIIWGSSLSEVSAAGRLDEDGILIMGPPRYLCTIHMACVILLEWILTQ